MKKGLITVIIAACFASTAHAKSFDSQAYSALDIDTGARAIGMGSAFTAIANDASAIFWNPAGLASVKMIELDLAYDKWLLDSNFQYAAAALPLSFGTLAVQFVYSDFGFYERWNEAGEDMDSQLKLYNAAGGAAYGFPVTDFLSAGVTLKFVSLSVDIENMSGVMADLGLMYKLNDMFSFGLSGQNFGVTETLLMPGSIRLGAAGNILNTDMHGLITAADLKYSDYYGFSFSAGAEYTYSKFFSIRMGYKAKAANSALGSVAGINAGAGIVINNMSFDYAFTMFGDLGSTHLVCVKILAETPEQKEKQSYAKLTGFLAYQYFREGQDFYDARDYENALTKWKQVKDMAPDYEGVDKAIQDANRMKQGLAGFQKAEKIFNEGMELYQGLQYDKAVKKWEEVKKIDPGYKEIDTWLDDAREMNASKGVSKLAEEFFSSGLKYYNNCEYAKALSAWQTGLEKDPYNRKIKQYIDRTTVKQQEIQEGLKKAKQDIEKDATVIAGIKRLRNISVSCPAYKDATDILDDLRGRINEKVTDYYYKGIEKYTDGNLDAAIVYWKSIEELDPKSDFVLKVKRYIEDARNKQKALQGFEKQK